MLVNQNKESLVNNKVFGDETVHPLIRVDMHCHSVYSDGTLTPEQIAKKLSDAGVKYAALTDHNTLAGLPTFRNALMQHDIAFIPGVEITTKHKKHIVHLLAYGFDPTCPELNTLLTEKNSDNNTSGSSAQLVFRTAAEIFIIIHRCGGIVVLAHPLQTEPDLETLWVLVHDLKNLGLDGIEALYGPNSLEQEARLLEIASTMNLHVSAGTDYHTPNDTDPGITISMKQWRIFRDALLRTSAQISQRTAPPYAQLPRKSKNQWLSFIVNIFLPAFFTLVLFIVALFIFLLPYFEQTLLERKRENIRQLTQVAWGVLNEAAEEVENGQLSLVRAQKLAKDRIAAMRYGPDNQDYFWLQDTTPRILMHPYRTDLNNQDVSDFQDAQGTRIFVAFSDLVLERNEGYISYVWQWMDDTDRIEPKESYIRLFEPWGWVIGTGIYVYDVQAEIANLRGYIVKISIVVIFLVLILLLYLIRQSILLEKSRSAAEKLLLESTERYHTLSEAATEGALFVYNDRCRYANTVMYELLGCVSEKLELLHLNDVFPDIKENRVWRDFLTGGKTQDVPIRIGGVIRRCDGTLLNCSLSVKSGMSNPKTGFMILVRRSSDITEYTDTNATLNRLLHIPTSIVSDLADSIKNATQITEVITLCRQTTGLVISLLENGTSSIAIAYMISTISDLATQKIIELTINEIGYPPVPYSFIALGSHGRQSLTLFSDQDNALIYEMSGKEDAKIVQTYFLKLGTRICDALEEAGYRKCIGNKVASNPEWCQPLSAWKKYFEEWIRCSEPQQVVEFSILFDFRSVSGDSEIASELRRFIYAEIKETPFFLSQIAQNALIFKTPLRLFGSIVTSGGKSHPGRIDVKTPAMAIVSFARLYALKHTIRETNTLLQLTALKNMGIILDARHRDIVTAYETLMRLRLWNQALAIEHKQQLDNWIDPSQLGHLEEVILRECFKEIDEFQGMIQRDFLD
jgi:predicted metal-dependent phosphoesterase TrpH/PAS domain-containing protein